MALPFLFNFQLGSKVQHFHPTSNNDASGDCSFHRGDLLKSHRGPHGAETRSGETHSSAPTHPPRALAPTTLARCGRSFFSARRRPALAITASSTAE